MFMNSTMKAKKGLFIALYGINNIGKSKQCRLLVNRIEEYENEQAVYQKFPFYDLIPTGPLINDYLRGGNTYNLSAREIQTIYAFNRTQGEKIISDILESGIHVIAEDYTGTGIAWGMGANVDKHYLLRVNTHLNKEDISILLDGERFKSGHEKGHKHEDDGILTRKVRHCHKVLANELGWYVINANQDIQIVHEEIWSIIAPQLNI
jgi:thymidylate kinase